MRFGSLLAAVGLLATYAFAQADDDSEVFIEIDEITEPEISIITNFPESNPFGHVVNGEANQVFLNIENKSDKNVTLLSVAGAFHDAQTDNLIKATGNLTYGIMLLEGTKIQLPYGFHSEFKTGDIKLDLWLEFIAEGTKYRVSAFDAIVTIVEPEISVFDFKLLSTYATVLAILGSLGYFAFLTFVPQPKKTRKAAVSAPTGSVTATSAGGYQEEWIPEHHLKKGKGKKAGVVSSGDELSGAEVSGADGKRRKGRK